MLASTRSSRPASATTSAGRRRRDLDPLAARPAAAMLPGSRGSSSTSSTWALTAPVCSRLMSSRLATRSLEPVGRLLDGREQRLLVLGRQLDVGAAEAGDGRLDGGERGCAGRGRRPRAAPCGCGRSPPRRRPLDLGDRREPALGHHLGVGGVRVEQPRSCAGSVAPREHERGPLVDRRATCPPRRRWPAARRSSRPPSPRRSSRRMTAAPRAEELARRRQQPRDVVARGAAGCGPARSARRPRRAPLAPAPCAGRRCPRPRRRRSRRRRTARW